MREEQIVYEKGNLWVCEEAKGVYTVWLTGITHSTKVGTVSYPDDPEKAWDRVVRMVNNKFNGD